MRRGLHFLLVAAMLSNFVHVADARGIVDRTKPGLSREIAADPSLDVPAKQDVEKGIAIRHVRLEASPPVDGSPSVVLKFDLHNQGWTSVTDIVLSVSLRSGGSDTRVDPSTRVQPFRIKIQNVLLAGYSFDYEIRLRNVSLDTASAPEIEVVDAHRVVDDVF
jgi:hypothetical protein